MPTAHPHAYLWVRYSGQKIHIVDDSGVTKEKGVKQGEKRQKVEPTF